MKLTLRQLNNNGTRQWQVNDQILETDGGLYLAMDMALAFGLGQTTLDNLPDKPWTYHKDTDTYENEV